MQLGLMKASMYRRNIHWKEQIDDAVEVAQLADDLGIEHIYFDGICSCDPKDVNPNTLLLAKLADVTKQIKAGVNSIMLGEPQSANFAQTVSLLDQILNGRLFLGLPSPESSAIVRQYCKHQSIQQFSDTLSQLLVHWREIAPVHSSEILNKFGIQKIGSSIGTPLKCPHPDIWSFVGSGGYDDVEVAASKGFQPVSASWMSSDHLAGHWPAFVAGATRAGRWACPSSWQVARSFFICDDDITAENYVKGKNSPYRQYYQRILNLRGCKTDLDSFLDKVVIRGSVEKVTDDILTLQDAVGEFGTLLYLDLEWSSHDFARSSIIKMAERVMPAVYAANPKPSKELERI